MQMFITLMAVIAGMIFSLAVALLAEELIFGQVFRLFFASNRLVPQTVAVKSVALESVALKSLDLKSGQKR